MSLLNRATLIKTAFTIALLAIVLRLALSADFYSSSMVDVFMAMALSGAVITLMVVQPSWLNFGGVVACGLVLAAVDYRVMGFQPRLMAWFSFAGLGALIVLGSRTIWARPQDRKLLLYAFLPALLFVASEYMASTLLDFTEALHPKTFDLFLYSADCSLWVQFSFLMGQAYALSPWFRFAGLLFYIALPLPMALVYAAQLRVRSSRAFPVMLAFLVTGPIGVLYYNLVPATGPVHVFGQNFPWHPLLLSQAKNLLLETIAIKGARNAIPSLHMTWVLLIWWNSKGLARWIRGVALAFVIFTVMATLGTGEHYFVDLVVAFPFALMIQALCLYRLPFKNGPRRTAFLFGTFASLSWMALISFAPKFLWISPVIPWTLVIATIAISSWMVGRLMDAWGKVESPSQSRASTTTRSSLQASKKQTLVLCPLLAALVFAFYWPVTYNSFLNFDDDGYITANSHVKAGLTGNTVKWAFTTYEQGNWHPLTWLSHATDVELFGLNPTGHHAVNVLLHVVNAILLFLLLQSATGFRWRSWMVAALFALHPINVESVAWAAERKNVLSTMFFLLAVYAYVWYTRKPELRRYATVALFFVLALLSKPQVITFPFLLLLLDYWPLRRLGSPATNEISVSGKNTPRLGFGELILEKAPFFLLAAISAAVTMKAQKAGMAVQTLARYSFLLRLETSAISYVRYIGKAFWPVRLVALYPHPTNLYPAWQVGAAVLLLLAITVLVLRARDQKYLAVGWFWFLGSMVPMVGLVQVGFQAMADRYAYIPFIGLFLMIVWGIGDWDRARRISARWLAIPAVASLLTLGTLTHAQVGYWHDPASFWQRTIALTEENYFAQVNLGSHLLSQNKIDDAAEHFRAALAIRPDGLTANLNLGVYEDRRGNLPAAIEHYEMVASHAADVAMRASAYGSLGFAYRQEGQSDKAKQCFETALELEPTWARSMTGLGLIAQDNGDLGQAVQQYSRAVDVQPSDVGYLLLAQALQLSGRVEEAKTISDRVARTSANLAEAQKAAESLIRGK